MLCKDALIRSTLALVACVVVKLFRGGGYMSCSAVPRYGQHSTQCDMLCLLDWMIASGNLSVAHSTAMMAQPSGNQDVIDIIYIL